MSEPRRGNVLNLFMTLRRGTPDEREGCAQEIETKVKQIARKHGLHIQVASEEENDENR